MALSFPNDQEKLLAFVDRRHPMFRDHLNHWIFCEETFKGGKEWFYDNVHRYHKEGNLEFQQRIARAFRFNHTKEVIQLITKYIFKEGVIRNLDDASSDLKSFWQNATLDGSSIDVLMKQVSNWTSINGRVWLVVDTTSNADVVLTKADEENNARRVYAYLVKQRDVLDYSMDDLGRLNWILYETTHRDDEDPISSSGEVFRRFVLWTRDEWAILEEHWEDSLEKPLLPASGQIQIQSQPVVLSAAQDMAIAAMQGKDRKIIIVRQGVNSLGEIPVFPADHVENALADYAPAGLVDDIVYLDKAVANYLSNIDAIIQDQTFSQLVMPSQGMMPGEEAYDKVLEMSTKRVFLYDGECSRAPEFISPDATNAQLIVAVIKTIIGEIYHSVGMAGERTKQDNAMGIDNSSGVAKAYDFDRMNAMLVAKADMLNRVENRLAYFVERYSNNISAVSLLNMSISANDSLQNLIKYPDDYDVRGLPDEFEIATSLQTLSAPDTARRQQMQNIINKLFPRLAKDIKTKMQTELKSWPVDPLDTMEAQLQLKQTYQMGNGTSVGVTDTPNTQGGQQGGSPSPKTSTGKTPNSKKKQGQNNTD